MISNVLVNMRVSPPPAERLFGHRCWVMSQPVTRNFPNSLTLATPSVIGSFSSSTGVQDRQVLLPLALRRTLRTAFHSRSLTVTLIYTECATVSGDIKNVMKSKVLHLFCFKTYKNN
jgi:hypothetical protein